MSQNNNSSILINDLLNNFTPDIVKDSIEKIPHLIDREELHKFSCLSKRLVVLHIAKEYFFIFGNFK